MPDYYIHECLHCGERTESKFCKDCRKKEYRKEMDENNRKLFAEKGLMFKHRCVD